MAEPEGVVIKVNGARRFLDPRRLSSRRCVELALVHFDLSHAKLDSPIRVGKKPCLNVVSKRYLGSSAVSIETNDVSLPERSDPRVYHMGAIPSCSWLCGEINPRVKSVATPR